MERLKKIMKWVGVDGLLHFLVCYGMMLAFTPIIGVWWALFAAVLASLVKEAIDSIMNDSDECNAAHDLICDGAGVLAALLTLLIWTVS